MAPLTTEDRCLLIKALQIEKGLSVDRMITEFPARQWKDTQFVYIKYISLYHLVMKNDYRNCRKAAC